MHDELELVVLCYTVLYCVIPCYTVLYRVILCYTVLYCVILCYTVLYYVVLVELNCFTYNYAYTVHHDLSFIVIT